MSVGNTWDRVDWEASLNGGFWVQPESSPTWKGSVDVNTRAFHTEESRWRGRALECSSDSKTVRRPRKHHGWISCCGGNSWLQPQLSFPLDSHHVHTEASLPIGCSQPMTDHGEGTSAGPDLWDGDSFHYTLRTLRTCEDSPSAWPRLLDWLRVWHYSNPTLFPLLYQTCSMVWKLCLPTPASSP